MYKVTRFVGLAVVGVVVLVFASAAAARPPQCADVCTASSPCWQVCCDGPILSSCGSCLSGPVAQTEEGWLFAVVPDWQKSSPALQVEEPKQESDQQPHQK